MNFYVRLRSILFDPLRARLIYDFSAIIFSSLFVWSVLRLYGLPVPNFFGIFLITAITITCLFGFGIYGRFRLASIFTKLVALVCAVLVSALMLSIAGFTSLFLIFWSMIVLIMIILPRFAFAFTLSTSTSFYRHTIKQDRLPVLVVGGGGYIGSHVVEQLLNDGFLVRVFDAFHYGKEVLGDLQKNSNLELVEGDISDIYKLTLAMQGVGSVIHLAGIVGDPACAVDPELTRHVNIISTRILKESAKAMGVRRFIFASSCSVYGSAKEEVNETSTLNPVSLYARTKIDTERELLSDTHDAFHPIILRFSTVFGHSRKPRFDLVANLFVAQAYEDGEVNLLGKNQWRPFVHVSDVARAIVLALKAPEARVSRQIFNVGDDNLNLTIGDLAYLAAKVVGKSKRGKKVIVNEKSNISDERNYKVSFEKIRKVLGFKAHTTIEMGMVELYECFKNKTYRKNYLDPYYSNLESAKELKSSFHSADYRSSHISILSENSQLDRVRTEYNQLRS